MKYSKKQNIIISLIIVAFSFILYGNTILNGYSFDDDFVCGKNAVVTHKGVSAIPEIFRTRYSTGKDLTFGYRPIPKVSFAIEYEFFGPNPHISHFINILLYSITGLLLFFLFRKILKSYHFYFSLGIVLLFLSHSVHTEVVASLKNREEILYFLFALFSLLFFIKFFETKKYLNILIGLFFICASYLCKQSALGFLIIIPMVLFFMFGSVGSLKDMLNQNKYIIIAFFILAFGFILVSLIPSKFLQPESIKLLSLENPLHFESSKWVRYATGFNALLYYLKLLIFPHPLSFYYGANMIEIINWTDFRAILSLGLHGFLLIFALKKISKKEIVGLGILIYLSSIFMFSNIATAVNGIIGERFLYAPSLGFSIVIVWLVFKILRVNLTVGSFSKLTRNKLILIFSLIVIPFSIKTIARNTDWKDEFTLFKNDISHLENSVKANDILATALLDSVYSDIGRTKNKEMYKKEINDIVKYFTRSLQLYPQNPKALNNLGGIYLNFFNQPATSIVFFKKALVYEPDNIKIIFNLGQCNEYIKNFDLSFEYYKQAYKLDSSLFQAKVGMANSCFGKGQLEEAVKFNEELARSYPKADFPFVNIGNYYFLKKDTATAVIFWEKAYKINPNNKERGIALYKYFKKKGDIEKSDYYLKLTEMAK